MKKILSSLVLVGLLAVPLMGMAVVSPTPPSTSDLPTVIDKITNWALGILIAFAVLMLIIAGFLFVTAQGDPDKVKTARNFVLWALVGVLVGLLSYALVQFVKVNLT